MIPRAVVLCLVLLVATVGVQVGSRREQIPARQTFESFPNQVAEWRGESTERFDQQVLTVLGVDDYLNRVYAGSRQESVGFYVGYYQSQRQGSKLHSPLVCLPGAGWVMERHQLLTIPVTTASGPRSIEVNRLVIAKGLNKQVVLYWYQSQGRVVANEYWGKFYAVADAVKNRRTDTAIVRVTRAVSGSDAGAEARAEQAAIRFTQAAFPLLPRYLPD